MNSPLFTQELRGEDPSEGIQTAYAGPHPNLEKQDYGGEEWFVKQRDEPDRSIITDIYLGFRQKPHFTLAVSRDIDVN